MSGEQNVPYTGPTTVDPARFAAVWARCFNCCRMVRHEDGHCPNCRAMVVRKVQA